MSPPFSSATVAADVVVLPVTSPCLHLRVLAVSLLSVPSQTTMTPYQSLELAEMVDVVVVSVAVDTSTNLPSLRIFPAATWKCVLLLVVP